MLRRNNFTILSFLEKTVVSWRNALHFSSVCTVMCSWRDTFTSAEWLSPWKCLPCGSWCGKSKSKNKLQVFLYLVFHLQWWSDERFDLELRAGDRIRVFFQGMEHKSSWYDPLLLSKMTLGNPLHLLGLVHGIHQFTY